MDLGWDGEEREATLEPTVLPLMTPPFDVHLRSLFFSSWKVKRTDRRGKKKEEKGISGSFVPSGSRLAPSASAPLPVQPKASRILAANCERLSNFTPPPPLASCHPLPLNHPTAVHPRAPPPPLTWCWLAGGGPRSGQVLVQVCVKWLFRPVKTHFERDAREHE